jgi:hypothetical protein
VESVQSCSNRWSGEETQSLPPPPRLPCTKMIILPRQARDRHAENLLKKGTVSAGTSDAICQCSPDPLPQQAINAQQSGGDDAEGVCSCDRMSDDLAQLFEPLNRRGATDVRKHTHTLFVATKMDYVCQDRTKA